MHGRPPWKRRESSRELDGCPKEHRLSDAKIYPSRGTVALEINDQQVQQKQQEIRIQQRKLIGVLVLVVQILDHEQQPQQQQE